MDAATLWLLTDIALPMVTVGVFLAILLFFNSAVVHLSSVVFVQSPLDLRRSGIVAVQTVAVQLGLGGACVGMLFWSLQHGAMYGVIDTSQLQLLFADCDVHCGVEHLDTVSAATGAELLTVLTEWAGALLWVELSVGGLLMISAGLVLSIQLNTTFGNGLWMALIKDMMNVCFFLLIGVAYLALSTITTV